MITTKVFAAPTHTAYELLAKCRLLTLSGIQEDGELEWIGTFKAWHDIPKEEQSILYNYEAQELIRKSGGVW